MKLYPTHTGCGPDIPIYVADDLAREGGKPRARLRILCQQVSSEDRLRIEFNGTTLTAIRTEPKPLEWAKGEGAPGWTGAEIWLLKEVDPGMVKQGTNTVRVTLEERNPAIVVPPQVVQVEIETWFS